MERRNSRAPRGIRARRRPPSGRRAPWLFATALAIGGSAAVIVYGTYSPGGGTEREAGRAPRTAPEPSASPETAASASPVSRPSPGPSRTAPATPSGGPSTGPATAPTGATPSGPPSATPAERATGEPVRRHRSDRPDRPSRPGHGGGALARGSRGPGVADLQRRLQKLYLYLGSADGHYSADVSEAVGRFQRARAIDEPSGVYGPATRALLEEETGG
ncbi:peptidoglycan-binding domain-containing protein [Streptomyces albiaxialis]|uniref:peptidoglycan-binding domain-containing protein n=1 Tax=Streptomyces albiaxialis TaxID=329523 RepID=UPI0031DE9609